MPDISAISSRSRRPDVEAPFLSPVGSASRDPRSTEMPRTNAVPRRPVAQVFAHDLATYEALPINTGVGRGGKETFGSEKSAYQEQSLTRRFGKLGIFILVAGNVVIAGSIAFLAFLWFSDYHNPTWHSIVVQDWLVQAVSIASEAIKQSVTFQIGVIGAMMAALVLERLEASLFDSASLSMMRAGTGPAQLFNMAMGRLHRRHFRGRRFGLTTMILTSVIIVVLSQVISIVLISDIGLQSIPGNGIPTQIPIGFSYKLVNHSNIMHSHEILEGTTWSKKPSFYPTFAEYSEPPYEEEGMSDTGVTLRAFLPFVAAQDRHVIQKFVGRTTVLDSRVTCQVPEFEGEGLQIDKGSGSMSLSGSVRATKNTPRLGNFTMRMVPAPENTHDPVFNMPVLFKCLVPIEGVEHFDDDIASGQPWRITLCQLGEGGGTSSISGGLVSEFKPLNSLPTTQDVESGNWSSRSYGTAYMILNVTHGSTAKWRAVIEGEGPVSPPAFSINGEWRNLVYSNADLVLGVTLCYSAFDTADISVSISSKQNRTEPTSSFDFKRSIYRFKDVRDLLGQGGRSLDDRGVLSLERRPSWIAAESEVPPVEPFVRDLANPGSLKGSGNNPNFTAILWQASGPDSQAPAWLEPDSMYTWLFQEIVTTGGSVAFALQSLITILSGVAYYDQIAQFDNTQPVEVVNFVTANIPQHCVGFIAVCIVLGIHMLVVAAVVAMFWRGSHVSMLGNTWQAISQVATAGETMRYIEPGSRMKDSEIETKMKEDGREQILVGVAPLGLLQRIGMRQK